MAVPGTRRLSPRPGSFLGPSAPAGAGARPSVLEAGTRALIPLRPLTIGEILDGAFLIVRRNVRLMIGLPLVIAGGTAAYLLAGIGLWIVLGNTTIEGIQILQAVLMGLFGLLLLSQCLAWMTAILSRVGLQTVLGEGFAPAQASLSLRSAGSLFWPILGLSLLQYLVSSVVQTVTGLLYYVFLGVFVASGSDNEAMLFASLIVVNVITFLILGIGYAYLSLTVPAYAVESQRAPAWIGKPLKPTTVISSFERSFRLVGLRNMLRAALVYCGSLLVCIGVIGIVAVGALGMVLLFAGSINVDVEQVLTNPWTQVGVLGFAVVVAISALLAYVAAVQVLLYLDLRMRREGLDLALRFDRVPVPQPSAPPVVWVPYPQPGLPYGSAGPPR